MKIHGQAGVLGLGFKFLGFMTLHMNTQSIFFGHEKKSKKFKKWNTLMSKVTSKNSLQIYEGASSIQIISKPQLR